MNPMRPPLLMEPLGEIEIDLLLGSLATAARPFLLESGLDVAGVGNWHLMGGYPGGEFIAGGGRWKESLDDGEGEVEEDSGEGDPLEALEAWWNRWSSPVPQSPAPFSGGAVGYIGYEAADHLHRLDSSPAPSGAVGEFFAGAPDIHLLLYDEVVAIDTTSGRGYFLHRDRRFQQQRRWWEAGGTVAPDDGACATPMALSITDLEYLEAIEEVRRRIGIGSVYEVNLTRGLLLRGCPDPWTLHRRWREVQPVPFGALLPWTPVAVVSASPERFLCRRGDAIETRPIKGTIPRGRDANEDRARGEQLLRNEKERAELAMIIDLERNDLGKVCVPGSVTVTEEARLETYPSVLHTVATVEGTLRGNPSPVDLLRATFPGGSITGAPKSAAISCIRELEPWPRKVYTGSIGWISPDGDLDLNIAIRTAMVRGDRAVVSLGGAVTWDSVARDELQELAAKGETILQALGCLP